MHIKANYFDSGEEELEEAVNTVTGIFRQSLASLLVKGNKESNLLVEGNKEANLPAVKNINFSEIEDTNNSPEHKDNLVSTNKKRDSSFGQIGPSENESERQGMDVNVKFTFDDSYLGEELDNVDVNTGQVPALSEATSDLLERPGNGKETVINLKGEATTLLPSPRGNKQPVYFEPQQVTCKHHKYNNCKTIPFQPDLRNLREETDGLKNVFAGERSVGKLDTDGAQRTPNVPGSGSSQAPQTRQGSSKAP